MPGDCGHDYILAIDPAPVQSGYLLWDRQTQRPKDFESSVPNDDMLGIIGDLHGDSVLVAIERIRSYGMPVGAETLETAEWTGRFAQKCEEEELAWRLVPRKEIVLHLCGSARAKDPNVRRALLDKFGPQGTKKAPGKLYGISGHAWAALAIAVYVQDTFAERKEQP